MQLQRQISFGFFVVLICASAAVPQETYFPKDFDQFRADWYSKQLKALKEPSLVALAASQKGESYRFLWLRTFHQPIAIRIDVKTDGTSQLTEKMTSGAGGYDPGGLVLSKTFTLTKRQTTAFLSTVRDNNLWKLPATQERGGMDGAQWVIELVKNGVYHIVDRWSPGNGPVRRTGMMMVHTLAKLKVPGPTY